MLQLNETYIVKCYTNMWTVIDIQQGFALLKNDTYGDETCYLIVKQNAKIEEKVYIKRKSHEKIILPTIMETVCGTYDDLITALEDECII